MIDLLVDSESFDMIERGSISHLIVCKEEGIQMGDLVSLHDDNILSFKCKKIIKKALIEGLPILPLIHLNYFLIN